MKDYDKIIELAKDLYLKYGTLFEDIEQSKNTYFNMADDFYTAMNNIKQEQIRLDIEKQNKDINIIFEKVNNILNDKKLRDETRITKDWKETYDDIMEEENIINMERAYFNRFLKNKKK